MHLRAPAILLSARHTGETAVVAQVLTADHGLVAAYVAGGRGRQMRPVVIPGNLVELQLTDKPGGGLPFAKLELLQSRGPWLGEPLAAAAIGWVTALSARALPERQPFPALYQALGGLLEAICLAPSARGWAGALVAYEAGLLRELGYGAAIRPAGDLPAIIAAMDRLTGPLDHYLLAELRGDVMAARHRLRELLGRIET
jgi:DNA repair protein RecO (recombination protein O)